jgi:hypothetical protein
MKKIGGKTTQLTMKITDLYDWIDLGFIDDAH